ncbi:hypothetical protein [Nostoc commune]|nr:hypothetical protein [Nostoc commune]
MCNFTLNWYEGMAMPCPYDKSICIKIFVNWYQAKSKSDVYDGLRLRFYA